MSYWFFLDENHSLVGVSGWSWEWASGGLEELLVRPCRGVETWRMAANRFVRYSCSAQIVIRQVALTQDGWRGIVSSKERSAHILDEKCALFGYEIRYKT
jgi:hypothetical protein